MPTQVHDLVLFTARTDPTHIALKDQTSSRSYAELSSDICTFANGIIELGLSPHGRVAIYAEKRIETVTAMFGTSAAGGVYVPVNPLLKPEQVAHILTDCGAEIVVTTPERSDRLEHILPSCTSVKAVIVMEAPPETVRKEVCRHVRWDEVMAEQKNTSSPPYHRAIDSDMAAILYTSGSTGRPKGVVLSHRNIVAGAESVAQYLELSKNDRVLSVLPLSFDYGMNQLTATFRVGGTVVLMNHLFPQDILTRMAEESITGLAAVPPLWIQLARLDWPKTVVNQLRYITNSGGHMPREVLATLRRALPRTKPYLMYGLTEAFRSTYLPPDEIDSRPDSVGKAIPNAEILVVRPDGTRCNPGEAGELVHRGVHVAMGYWNDPEKTAERFKPVPGQPAGLTIPEIAVWSGDTFREDEDGYLYFVSRQDEMIKTSGYRVSPTEIEDVLYTTGKIAEGCAFGVPHPALGQAIVVIALPTEGTPMTPDDLQKIYRTHVPTYMIPAQIELVHAPLPRNPNGKIDRKKLAQERIDLFLNALGEKIEGSSDS